MSEHHEDRLVDRQTKRILESFIYPALRGGVTPETGTSKTWTYTPRDSMSVTVGPKQALWTALYIVGQVIRHPRSNVTWDMWSDADMPYSLSQDSQGESEAKPESPA